MEHSKNMPLPDPVEVECPLCQRHGRYRLARYVEIAGTDNGPMALVPFAAAMGCERAKFQIAQEAKGLSVWYDRCKCVYRVTWLRK